MKHLWREIRRLAREFVSVDDTVVDRKTVIVALAIFFLSTPVQVLCFAVVIRHVWTLGKSLDGPVVNLLIVMLGASTGGLVSALVSKFIGPAGSSGLLGGAPKITPANPAPPEKGG